MNTIQEEGSSSKAEPPITQRRMSRAGLRRPSVAFHGSRRLSTLTDHSSFKASSMNKHMAVKQENTYQLKPNDNQLFAKNLIKNEVEKYLEDRLKNEKYNSDQTTSLLRQLTENIRQRVKENGCNRHKIVMTVLIHENTTTDCRIASQCLWNPEFDSFVTCQYANKHLVCICTVYGLYYD
ncbi:hypothetical protein SNEBB_003358 [Seison nebaliae]|nr:hypothetical protein SNEBB_003358 [Seison nebaliae]